MKGLIFDIKRYSVHDGPGIRVTFFMKGCPLRCNWCHNPEGINPLEENVIQSHRLGDREFKRNAVAGKFYSVEDLISILDREKVFLNQSKGGVTFSGGEPMFQFDFLLEALKTCKSKGYHTAVDTSGYSPTGNFEAILSYTDLFLFDIKHLDDAAHIEATGVSNILILENYRFLLGKAREVMLRIPVIPGFNDDPDHIERLKQFIIANSSASLRKISLLPYHKTGSSKYKKFNIPYKMADVVPPSAKRMHALREYFLETGLNVKIGG